MKREPPLAVWQDLPDPRDSNAPHGGCISVIVDASAWKHIAIKHVSSRGEPWSDIFWPEMVRAIRFTSLDGENAPADCKAIVEEALWILGNYVRESLARPMVVMEKRRRWTLVLRCGALAVIADIGKRGLLVTCYIPKKAAVYKNVAERWQRVARDIVKSHLGIDPMTMSLASAQRSHARFVTPATWGLDAGVAGSFWQKKLGDWDQAGTRPAAGRAAGSRPSSLKTRRKEESQ